MRRNKLWLTAALLSLMAGAGCCAWCDRWCPSRASAVPASYAPAGQPCCCPPPCQPCCPTTTTVGTMPPVAVPPPPAQGWARNGCSCN
ncbi:MAG TPA: hypothetical protein VEL76_30640 [Gemmataceae bacterium]|nr:hypothetical protein [Gemmataceae bacterium]